MKKVLIGILTILLLILSSGSVPAVQQAFLIQNSGWMEPFYADRRSEFKPLIIATVEAVAGSNEPVSILAFSQTTPRNESPVLLYNGTIGNELREAVGQIEVAHKGVGKALADTDFREAIYKTITGPFKGATGILWIFTNNKNSPYNSPETAERNREFYNLVHSDPSITRSVAFPLAMPVKGDIYTANGLMIYALAYGAEADTHLKSILSSKHLKDIITQQPAQLKPLDKDAALFIPKAVIDSPNTTTVLGSDGRTIIVDINVSFRQPVVYIVTSLKNLFYPYRILSADIAAQIVGKDWSNILSVSPQKIDQLAPDNVSDVTIAVPIRAELPPVWSLSSFFDFGRQVRIPSMIHIRFENQRLGIDDSFLSRLGQIFPGDPLPEVFLPPESIKVSTTAIPLLIRVNYPVWPLMLLLGGIFLLLITGLFVFSRMRSNNYSSYEIEIDGLKQRISLGRFERRTILNGFGQPVGVIRRRAGNPKVLSVSPGHTLSLHM